MSRPSKWQGLFNIKNIISNFTWVQSQKLGGCSVTMTGRTFTCYPIDFQLPEPRIVNAIPGLKTDILSKLHTFTPVEFNRIEELLLYSHLDLIYAYLTHDGDQFLEMVKQDTRFTPARKKYRPSLLEVNQNSIHIERNETIISSSRNVPDTLLSAFETLGTSSLELPGDYDLNRTLSALRWYNDLLTEIGFPDKERGYHLKFKRLGTYSDNGFYSFETNTVIVDPREIDIFFHEIGHLIYDRGVIINLNVAASNSEDYAQRFWDTVVRAGASLTETADVEAEVPAFASFAS